MKIELLVIERRLESQADVPFYQTPFSVVIGAEYEYTVTAPTFSSQVQSMSTNREKAIESAKAQIRELLDRFRAKFHSAERIEVEI